MEIPHVPHMQEVKTTVREDQFLTLIAELPPYLDHLVKTLDLPGSHRHVKAYCEGLLILCVFVLVVKNSTHFTTKTRRREDAKNLGNKLSI